MSVKSRPKGAAFEREFARAVGGKRTPLSGGAGGNDITFAPGSLWDAWGWEAKRRASLPVFVVKALVQAEAALPIGSRRRPAMAMREDNGRTIVAFYWDDLRPWVQAQAETGRGSRIRELARELERIAQALKGMAA